MPQRVTRQPTLTFFSGKPKQLVRTMDPNNVVCIDAHTAARGPCIYGSVEIIAQIVLEMWEVDGAGASAHLQCEVVGYIHHVVGLLGQICLHADRDIGRMLLDICGVVVQLINRLSGPDYEVPKVVIRLCGGDVMALLLIIHGLKCPDNKLSKVGVDSVCS